MLRSKGLEGGKVTLHNSLIHSILHSFKTHLTPSVLGCFFIFILLIICCTASEIHVGIKIGQILAINLLTSIHPS